MVGYLRNCVRCHFVSIGVKILHLTVISPFVRDVESGCYWAAIGVDASLLKKIHIQLLIQIIYRIIKGQEYDLGNAFSGQFAWQSDRRQY